MLSRTERYRKCVATCASTDYASKDSLREHNNAATEMRRIASEPGAEVELLPLLDEPHAAEWLAFQAIELWHPSPEIRQRCVAIIQKLAAGSGLAAKGAKGWLQNHGL